jgi:hypothetical protein
VTQVYLYHADNDRYHEVAPVDRSYEDLRELDGKRLADGWVAPTVRLVPVKAEPDLAILGGHIPIVNVRARTALESLWTPVAEFLPLRVEGSPTTQLFAVNILAIVPALDSDRAEVERFPGSGRIMHVERFAFKEEVIGDLPLFRLIEMPFSDVFLSQSSREAIERHQLAGLKWKPLL